MERVMNSVKETNERIRSFSWRGIIIKILKVFMVSATVVLFLFLTLQLVRLGYVEGYKSGQKETVEYYESILDELTAELEKMGQNPVVVTRIVEKEPQKLPEQTNYYDVSWGGPQLWEAVNKRRKEFGVNPLENRSELCTIASIRLNELLELGKLDNHEGFSNLQERRPDLEWVFEKYSTLAEFLAFGGKTPEETVSLWENTLGHKKLLTGGEYVWGCIYAQNTFAVAITAF